MLKGASFESVRKDEFNVEGTESSSLEMRPSKGFSRAVNRTVIKPQGVVDPIVYLENLSKKSTEGSEKPVSVLQDDSFELLSNPFRKDDGIVTGVRLDPEKCDTVENLDNFVEGIDSESVEEVVVNETNNRVFNVLNDDRSFVESIFLLDSIYDGNFRFVRKLSKIDDFSSNPIQNDLEFVKSKIQRFFLDFLTMEFSSDEKLFSLVWELLLKMGFSDELISKVLSNTIYPQELNIVKRRIFAYINDVYKQQMKDFNQQMEVFDQQMEVIDDYKKLESLDPKYINACSIYKIFQKIDFVQSYYGRKATSFSGFVFNTNNNDAYSLLINVLNIKIAYIENLFLLLSENKLTESFDFNNIEAVFDDIAIVYAVSDAIRKNENYDVNVKNNYLFELNSNYLKTVQEISQKNVLILSNYEKSLQFLDSFKTEIVQVKQYEVFRLIDEMISAFENIEKYYEEFSISKENQIDFELEKRKIYEYIVESLKFPSLSQDVSVEEIEWFFQSFKDNHFLVSKKNSGMVFVQIENAIRFCVQHGGNPTDLQSYQMFLTGTVLRKFIENDSIISEKSKEAKEYIDSLFEQLSNVSSYTHKLKENVLISVLPNARLKLAQIAQSKLNQFSNSLNLDDFENIVETYINDYVRIRTLVQAVIPMVKG